MYVVTNRNLREGKSGLDQFGGTTSTEGPHELRVASVVRRGSGWNVTFFDDQLSDAEVHQLKQEFELSIDETQPHYASLKVACDMIRSARARKRNILFYVHGYNNDMKDVVNTAAYLEQHYEVEVVAFSWPANGGGAGGAVSYKSDKRDARASTDALDRVLCKMHEYLSLISEANRIRLRAIAARKHPDNLDAREELYVQLLEKHCPFTVNALFHSMGNYLLKQALKSSLSDATELLFDNIVLCQADTNNLDHDLWVGRLNARNRIYITLNENDFALAASRAKVGSAQLARLGHYSRRLDSRVAYYINFTGAAWVQRSHSPFREPARRNKHIGTFFRDAFSGTAAETHLRFHAEGNWYEVP